VIYVLPETQPAAALFGAHRAPGAGAQRTP